MTAQKIVRKTITKVTSYFHLPETKGRLALLDTQKDIRARQKAIASIPDIDASFIRDIPEGERWHIPYSVIVATDCEDTYLRLVNEQIPSALIQSTADIQQISGYDVIQTDLDIELPNAVPCNQTYPERYLQDLARSLPLLKTLDANRETCRLIDPSIPETIRSLLSLSSYLTTPTPTSRDEIEAECQRLNDALNTRLDCVTISGTALMDAMHADTLPSEVREIVDEPIAGSSHPDLFTTTLPIAIDEEQAERILRSQETDLYSTYAMRLQHLPDVQRIPDMLSTVHEHLKDLDFAWGISRYRSEGMSYPVIGTTLEMRDARNLFLKNPTPITFSLSGETPCSILTGANSGGKTTLIEHIIQLHTLMRLGLPVHGVVTMPLFSTIHYFTKNKGSPSKGAFETLLTQFASIEPSGSTLVLADELEAVTEPGVAADIICATAEYCIERGCYCIFATHIGKELDIPKGARIDGIMAVGLDKKNNVIFYHNPVMGHLASSTPELIMQRLAQSSKNPYYARLQEKMGSIQKTGEAGRHEICFQS